MMFFLKIFHWFYGYKIKNSKVFFFAEAIIFWLFISGLLVASLKKIRELFPIPEISDNKIVGYTQYFGYPYYFDYIFYNLFLFIPLISFVLAILANKIVDKLRN